MQQNSFNDEAMFEDQQNQFLSGQMDYEACPFCQRKFFRGKLAYHLKLCTQDNPMIKSKKNSPRHKKNSLSAANSYQRCTKCQTRIPSYLIKKHQENCQISINNPIKNKVNSFKYTPDANETQNQALFPKIRKTTKQISTKLQKKLTFFTTDIKVRDELRCFRKAQEVQKVTCNNCGRKFSQAASLRHIPVCSSLKTKQKKTMGSTLIRNKYINPSIKIHSTRTDKTQENTKSFVRQKHSSCLIQQKNNNQYMNNNSIPQKLYEKNSQNTPSLELPKDGGATSLQNYSVALQPINKQFQNEQIKQIKQITIENVDHHVSPQIQAVQERIILDAS